MVADQAANMKKAFWNEYASIDCDEIQLLINDLLLNQKKEDMKKKEAILRDELEKDISSANEKDSTDSINLSAQLMLDLNFLQVFCKSKNQVQVQVQKSKSIYLYLYLKIK